MARPRATKTVNDQVVDRLKKRDRWQAALLAEQLGWSRRTVYKYINAGDLVLENGFVSTSSVVRLLEK